jgi:hypothetical protein
MESRHLSASGFKVPVLSFGAASDVTLPYPYWHQRFFAECNPPPV